MYFSTELVSKQNCMTTSRCMFGWAVSLELGDCLLDIYFISVLFYKKKDNHRKTKYYEDSLSLDSCGKQNKMNFRLQNLLADWFI